MHEPPNQLYAKNIPNSIQMAGIKRKEATVSAQQGGNAKKRPRKEETPTKNHIEESYAKETATDSEPIVESDTTSQSGEDDGVTWPSDADQEGEDWGGVKENDNSGGMKVIAESADGTTKPKATIGAGTGTGTST